MSDEKNLTNAALSETANFEDVLYGTSPSSVLRRSDPPRERKLQQTAFESLVGRGFAVLPILTKTKRWTSEDGKIHENTRKGLIKFREVHTPWTSMARGEINNETQKLVKAQAINFAVGCGDVSGIEVIDFDKPKKDGVKSGIDIYNEMVAKHGPFTTLQATSMSGAFHVYFTRDANRRPDWKRSTNLVASCGKVLALDYLGNGGYVIVHPSKYNEDREGGKKVAAGDYKWIDPGAKIEPMPEWLESYLEPMVLGETRGKKKAAKRKREVDDEKDDTKKTKKVIKRAPKPNIDVQSEDEEPVGEDDYEEPYQYEEDDKVEAEYIVDNVKFESKRSRDDWVAVGYALGVIFRGSNRGLAAFTKFSQKSDYKDTPDGLTRVYGDWRKSHMVKSKPGVPVALMRLRREPKQIESLKPITTDTFPTTLSARSDIEKDCASLNDLYKEIDALKVKATKDELTFDDDERLRHLLEETKATVKKHTDHCRRGQARILARLNHQWVYIKNSKGEVGDLTWGRVKIPDENGKLVKRERAVWQFRGEEAHCRIYKNININQTLIIVHAHAKGPTTVTIEKYSFNIAKKWLEWPHRNDKAQILWQPSLESFLESPHHHNIYRGPGISKDDVKKWLKEKGYDKLDEKERNEAICKEAKPYLDHVSYCYCHSDEGKDPKDKWTRSEFFHNIVGWWITRPCDKQPVMPTMSGVPGLGKTFPVSHFICTIIGHNNVCWIQSIDELTGPFGSALLKSSQLVILDDALKECSNTQRRYLKALTGQDGLNVNEKHKCQYVTDNYLNFLIINNFEGHTADMEHGDRRGWPLNLRPPPVSSAEEKERHFHTLALCPVLAVAAYYYLIVGPRIEGRKFNPETQKPNDVERSEQIARTMQGELGGWVKTKLTLDGKYFEQRYVNDGIGTKALEEDWEKYRTDRKYKKIDFLRDLKQWIPYEEPKQCRCFGVGKSYYCGCGKTAKFDSPGVSVPIHKPLVLKWPPLDICRKKYQTKISAFGELLNVSWNVVNEDSFDDFNIE